MAGKPAKLALDPQQNRARLRPLKLDLALALVGLDAVEAFQKIDLPEGATIFAIGDPAQADLFLLADDGGDLAVLDRAQGRVVDGAGAAPVARFLQRSGAQQRADMIGAEGRCIAVHGRFLRDGSEGLGVARRVCQSRAITR